jgi:hypothetical protein
VKVEQLKEINMNEINIDPGNKVAKFDSFSSGDEDKVALDERGGSKDRVALLKEGITVASGVDSDGDVMVQFAMLSERQEKDMEKALVDGDEESISASITNQMEEPVLEADGDNDDAAGSESQDALSLARFGYTKEQVDGWLAQGYSVSDIKNGVASSGERNTEVTNELPNVILGGVTNWTNERPGVPDERTNWTNERPSA